MPDTPFGWNGRLGVCTDANSGLMLMGARYYAPCIGRFTSRDPIGFDGGINLYGYCGGDPVNDADPDGYDPSGEEPGDDLDLGPNTSLGTALRRRSVTPAIGRALRPVATGLKLAGDNFPIASPAIEFLTGREATGTRRLSLGERAMAGLAIAPVMKPAQAAAKPLRLLKAAKGLTLCAAGVNRFRGEAKQVEALMASAARRVPGLVHKPDEWHHVVPEYLGGAADGPKLKLPRPYHQLVTNEFRTQWAYHLRHDANWRRPFPMS